MVEEETEKQENAKWLRGTATEICFYWKFPKSKFHTLTSVIRAVISG